MIISFTHHAHTRLKQRNISEKEIINAIKQPDIVTLEDEHKCAAYQHLNGYSLKVVYIESKDELKIITVFKISKSRVLKATNKVIQGEQT